MPKVYYKSVSMQPMIRQGFEADFVDYGFCRRSLCFLIIFLWRHNGNSIKRGASGGRELAILEAEGGL